jgi:hypothetical protein
MARRCLPRLFREGPSDPRLPLPHRANRARTQQPRLVTCVTLRDLLYPNLYTDVVEGTLDDGKDTIRLGFFTSEATKPLIIDKLRSSFKSGEVTINDPGTLDEMLTFVVTESGRLEAEGGAHDDTVIALALALYVHEGKFVPVTFSDDCYTKAI